MKKLASLLLALLFLALPLFTACQNALPSPSETAPGADGTKLAGKPLGERIDLKTGSLSEEFVRGEAAFALDLYRKFYQEVGKNALVSPLSVSVALAMTANGAKGETKKQLETLLCAGMDTDTLNTQLTAYITSLANSEKATLKAADSVWYAEDVLTPDQNYLNLLGSYYAAEVRKIDRSLAKPEQPVNDWVKKKTDGMIPSILSDGTINEYTTMILVNALSFIAEWQIPSKQTYKGTFTCSDGTKKTLSFFKTSLESGFIQGERETGFVKRYAGETYAFLALLPNEGISLSDYLASLDGETYLALVNGVQDRDVIRIMPEFTADSSASLVKILKTLGVTDAFEPDGADFSGIGASKVGALFVNEILHKTHIEVTKDGTKAAAVTQVGFYGATAVPPPTVALDRPFVYAIIDTATGLPIFFGCFEG
ncbi:MAG: serpin family protein [Clostridia bacterium]|nr:serpin family protein [Clostridia bacterium]